jgi:hypothetical protein
MKRLIKKSEIYDAIKNRDEYYEVFKNPTSSEINDIHKIDSDVRGLLYKDGTMYVWEGDLYHSYVSTKMKKLDFDQYHFFTEGPNWIRFHVNSNEIDFNEIKNAIKSSSGILSNIVNPNASVEILNCRCKDRGVINCFAIMFSELLDDDDDIEKV